jgi:hypothetical protein
MFQLFKPLIQPTHTIESYQQLTAICTDAGLQQVLAQTVLDEARLTQAEFPDTDEVTALNDARNVVLWETRNRVTAGMQLDAALTEVIAEQQEMLAEH